MSTHPKITFKHVIETVKTYIHLCVFECLYACVFSVSVWLGHVMSRDILKMGRVSIDHRGFPFTFF